MKRFCLPLVILLVLFILPGCSLAESSNESAAGILKTRSAGDNILADDRFPDANFRRALDEIYGDDDHFVNFNITASV